MPARSLALLGVILVATAAVLGAVAFGPQGLPSHTLTGTVSDPMGHPLAGATVELSLPASTGSVRPIFTGGDGKYRFDRVVPGLYVLTTRLAGFGVAIRDLEIGDGDTVFRFDVQLQPSVAGEASQAPFPSNPQRRVVCGLTLITPPNIDPKMLAPGSPSPPVTPFPDRLTPGPAQKSPVLPQPPLKPTMRTVQPTICWDPAPIPR